MTVLKTIRVADEVDILVENIVNSCNFGKVCLNGDDRVSVSGLFRIPFENIVKSQDKKAALSIHLKNIILKNMHGVPLNDTEIQEIVDGTFQC